MDYCYYHPDREAVAVCSKCGKPLCKECAIEYKGKIYCKDCFAEIKKKEEKKAAPGKESTKKKKSEQSPVKNEDVNSDVIKTVIIAIIISALVIGGIIILALFAKPKSGGGLANNNINNFSENELSVPLNSTSVNIKADINKADIKIIRSDKTNDKITISGTNIQPHVTYSGSTVEITTPFEILPWEKHKNREVTVEIPEKATGISLHIQSNIGDVYVSLPLENIENADIFTKIGDTVIENSDVETLYLADAVGDVELNNVSVTNCTIKNGTGDCEINGGSFTKLSIKQGTGDCNILAVKSIQEFSYGGGTGNFGFDLRQTMPPLKAEITNGIGEVTVKTDDKPAKIRVTAGMGINSSSIPVTNKVYKYGDSGKPYFDITVTTAGRVFLRR